MSAEQMPLDRAAQADHTPEQNSSGSSHLCWSQSHGSSAEFPIMLIPPGLQSCWAANGAGSAKGMAALISSLLGCFYPPLLSLLLAKSWGSTGPCCAQTLRSQEQQPFLPWRAQQRIPHRSRLWDGTGHRCWQRSPGWHLGSPTLLGNRGA